MPTVPLFLQRVTFTGGIQQVTSQLCHQHKFWHQYQYQKQNQKRYQYHHQYQYQCEYCKVTLTDYQVTSQLCHHRGRHHLTTMVCVI